MLNYIPVGKCSNCGGIVSYPNLPKVWMGVQRPLPACEECGAIKDESEGLPIIKTIKKEDMQVFK